MNSPYMTTKEAADYTRLTPYTIRQYCREHRLPNVKVGQTYRIKRDDLDKYLEAL